MTKQISIIRINVINHSFKRRFFFSSLINRHKKSFVIQNAEKYSFKLHFLIKIQSKDDYKHLMNNKE